MPMSNRLSFIVALVVLLPPVLYVGSYLALLKPPARTYQDVFDRRNSLYHVGGDWARVVFWPLEQIDRKVRPGAWR